MFEERLHCTIARKGDGVGMVQVCRVDTATGLLTDVGPLIERSMGHSLVIRSIPDDVEWRLLDGPALVDIESPDELVTAVELNKTGVCTFRLGVPGSDDLAGTVRIAVASSY